MSNTFVTLADLVKLNDKNANDSGISDLLNEAPFLAKLFAIPASNGTKHNFIKQTTAPSVGFRAVSTGKDNGASGYTEVAITLALLDASFIIDIALAKAYRLGVDAFLGREAQNQIKAAFFAMEQQVFYGTGAGAAAGFSGLGDDANYSSLSGALVVTAAGTTAATGSSCWLIRTTDDETSLAAVIGNGGEIEIGESVVTAKTDDSSATKNYSAYLTPIMGYCGIQIGGKYSAVRIGNITADSGKGLTDALISSAMALFPAGKGPTHIVMNRRSLQQLQKSRTATNPTGAPAPFPQDAFGVPIVVTDSISSTEALLT